MVRSHSKRAYKTINIKDHLEKINPNTLKMQLLQYLDLILIEWFLDF